MNGNNVALAQDQFDIKEIDIPSFEEIYQKFQSSVYQKALKATKGNSAEAEDISQTVFIKVFDGCLKCPF